MAATPRPSPAVTGPGWFGGGSAWWLDHVPASDAGNTPFILAAVDPDTGYVRLDLATVAGIEGIARAEAFRRDGTSVGRSRPPPRAGILQ